MEKQISSGLKNLFLIHFIVAILFGVVLFLIPQVYAGLFSWELGDAGAYRVVGAAMLGFGASSWFCYKNPIWEQVKIVVIAEIVWTGVGAIASAWAILTMGYPPIIWMNPVLFAIFTIGFVVFYQKEK